MYHKVVSLLRTPIKQCRSFLKLKYPHIGCCTKLLVWFAVLQCVPKCSKLLCKKRNKWLHTEMMQLQTKNTSNTCHQTAKKSQTSTSNLFFNHLNLVRSCAFCMVFCFGSGFLPSYEPTARCPPRTLHCSVAPGGRAQPALGAAGCPVDPSPERCEDPWRPPTGSPPRHDTTTKNDTKKKAAGPSRTNSSNAEICLHMFTL